jgi:hypothetical protein
VSYRGFTGFGKSFVNAGDKEWAGKMHGDLLDAIEIASLDPRFSRVDRAHRRRRSLGLHRCLGGGTGAGERASAST